MNVLSGENVDLLFPFPISEVKRTYGWNHCYRTITETDDSPKSQEEFLPYMEGLINSIPTWGIIDKNHITNIKHEAPLVGIVMFEPVIQPGSMAIRNGFFHVATARKAWRTGLVDEAGLLVIQTLFEDVPTLQRVSGCMMEKNFPAKALCKRLGFKFEGLIEDSISKDGQPENMVLFGLTRRKYNLCHLAIYSDPLVGQSVDLQEISLEAQAKVEAPLEPQVELKAEPPVEPLEELQALVEVSPV